MSKVPPSPTDEPIPQPPPNPGWLAAVQRKLLKWYDRNRRDLPWRTDPPEPYKVLVSEAMLQQTQVATVIAYFDRFIEAFPSIERLADADEQAVLRLWQGLGYYRRARHLHAAARLILEHHGGKVPQEVPDLLKLPGVGRYTAGAIASIAYGTPAPILDGNVMRVLSRWRAIEAPVDQPATQKVLWRWAEAVLPSEAPGRFNEGLMELGAMVCTPTSPACLTCPVAQHCQARQRGIQDRLPVRLPKAPPRPVEHHTLAIRRDSDGGYLFERRPAQGLWSNMWQLPTSEQPAQPMAAQQLQEWARERFGLRITPPRRLATFDHRTTHRAITFVLWQAQRESGRLKPRTGLWRRLEAVDDLPLAKPQLEAIRRLGAG